MTPKKLIRNKIIPKLKEGEWETIEKPKQAITKMLEIVGSYTDYKWVTVALIHHFIVYDEKHTKVISSEWKDSFKKNNSYYPLDLTNLKTWSTYDNAECIQLKFAISSGFLTCLARINDGRMLDGSFQNERFTSEIQLPLSFLIYIKEGIERKFSYHLEDEYETHLDTQKQLWMANHREKLLTGK